jgi:hypothetical protein
MTDEPRKYRAHMDEEEERGNVVTLVNGPPLYTHNTCLSHGEMATGNALIGMGLCN